MTRQNIMPNPSIKMFEAYMDFSGGRNSETSNDRLRPNEYPIFDNVDLSGRGSARRRTGRKLLLNQAGVGQGIFLYYRTGQLLPDIVFAVSGHLYIKENTASSAVEIPIKDGAATFTFQTTATVEAVQYSTDMFIATGTKLVELTYDTTVTPAVWRAKTVIPYTPSVMEAIYIGTNGLADNPDIYVQDGVSATLEAAGIKPAKRTATVNQKLQMVAYANKPASITNLTYRWEYKKSIDTTWVLGRDFTADAAGKTWDFIVDTAAKYDIRVTIKDNTAGVTTPAQAQYVLSSFVVNQVEDKTSNTSRPVNGIQRCRKIRLHWDRLIMAGDDANPFQMYISDLNNGRYFPVSNTISFDTGKQEPITSIVRFRDLLVVFTKTTVQTLIGKSVEDFKRSLIHDGIGCVADRSAQVTGNNIVFLSAEGIQSLKPNPYMLEVMNVQRIDYPIKTEVTADTDACAMVYDSQYWICFPKQAKMYRLYYDQNMWVRDKSSKITFGQMLHYGRDIYELSQDGKVYQQDPTRYNDDGEIYDMDVESKFHDMSASFNYKKVKRLYVLAKHFGQNIELKVKVQADSAIILNPDAGHAEVQNGYAVWVSETVPNIHFYAGTVVGSWILGQTPLGDVQISVQKAQVRGKCRRVKVRFVHTQDTPCEIFGFGIEFKLKKP